MDKLTPQNAQQEHMVQILLAKMQGVEVELYDRIGKEWITSATSAVYVDSNYRIKSHELPIAKGIWAIIDKKWKWAAKDNDGGVWFYVERPSKGDYCWYEDSEGCALNALALNTDGIDWRKSLTRRPEGV
ncbi:hypothetical protein J3U18_00120 [Gilliamella sp. B3482]|uniref:hypothetical protein n=1 Tax=Gilliamella sp. B3482 TaxID=2817991 RepID=UPI00226AB0FB|nr:hypothetical protein [Gilliamella sp. B3482]MCX8580098.1 hypothetical protein [Gilliamella sp. B3482]